MKVLLNAINLKVAGGVTVVKSFLKELRRDEFKGDYYHVLVPSGVGYESFGHDTIFIEVVPTKVSSPAYRLILDHTWLSRRVKTINPDVIFTMANIAIPSKIKQAVLFHFPYAMYPDAKEVWSRLSFMHQIDYRLRNYIFSKRLKYASVIFPQTESAKKCLLKYYKKEIKSIKVIPNATFKLVETNETNLFFPQNNSQIDLLCLSKYYSHKNVEILLDLAKLIKAHQSHFRIITTIEGNQGPGSQEFLDAIKMNNLGDIILNIGKVPMDQVPALYSQVDGLLLPTLLESFSATYIDSMTLGVPVFTSDRDFAHDVCGDTAWYFDPLNADSIFEVVKSAFQTTAEMERRITNGKSRAASMPDWLDVTRMYVQALKELCSSKGL